MTITKLEVLNFRNLQSVSLDLDPLYNLIIGLNASGKTSVLEAVHVLSSARSFRGTALQDLISINEKSFTISAVLNKHDERTVRIGIEKYRSESISAKKDGVFLKRVSDLAELLPVILLDSDAFQLVEGSPACRRDFLNLGMFHVEHSFFEVWKNFTKAHKQRNALLKQSNPTAATGSLSEQLSLWTEEFCRYAEDLHVLRQSFLIDFEARFLKVLKEITNDAFEVELQYKPGWNEEKGLRTSLNDHRHRELAFGSTLYGPHKADLQLANKRLFSRDFLSRGQKKLVIYAMRFALGEYIAEQGRRTPIMLLDDLPSELDEASCESICNYLTSARKMQTIITAVSNTTSVERIKAMLQPRMFHVEHGQIVEIA